jgi:hypothetical protein
MAAVTNVSVTGTTSTQAILRYTAPDDGVCTVEASENASFTPLVHDVDPQLFPGSNLDSRSEGASDGRQRVFVLGKRRAEKAANGHWYSRALQAFTAHYYRITCGADQVSDSFFTTNIPLGNTYNDTLPPDPNAGAATYFVNGGQYAWPEFIDWSSAGRGETVTDPHTGMLLKRLTMPGDQVTSNSPSGDHLFTSAISPNGAWSGAGSSLADDGSSASFSGAGRDWLLLRDSALVFNDYPLESLTFSVKGWCSGACAGDDAKIQACLTVNGVTCWPNQNNTIDMTLGTSNSGAFVSAGSTLPIMAAWTPPGYLPLNPTDTQARTGTVNVDGAGVVTLTDGSLFYPNWAAGSKFTIAGSECAITSVAHPKGLSIDPASCVPALSLPLTGATYSAGNFGVMIRKKTASMDTINIQFAKYSMTETNPPGWSSSGSPEFCSHTLTQNSVTGAMGYHCRIMESQLYWVDRATGNANYLGLYNFDSKTGPDGYGGGVCGNASVTLLGKGPQDPESFYCTTNDNSQKEIVLACSFTSTNEPRDLHVSCTNLTKSSLGQDFLSLVQQFTASDVTPFDPVKYIGCGITGMQNGQLILACGRGYQDTLGWIVVFDPNKVGSTPGCVGNGNPGCVVAAQSTWSSSPARWCSLHTPFMAGNSNTAWILGKPLGTWPGMPGGGSYTSTVVSGTLGVQPSIAPGTTGCPAGSKGCDIVTVDGEPCNSSPAPEVGGHPAEGGNCPKNTAWDYLQDAKPGDVFQARDNPREYVQLVAKSGNSWLLQRGYGYTSPSDVSSPVTLSELCLARRWDHDETGSWTWDFEHDPHALNANGTTIKITPGYEHPLPRAELVVGTVAWFDPGYGYAITDGPGYGPANKWSQLGPAFAGTTGITVYNELAGDHPSHPQETAPPQEQKWFLDSRPLHGPGPDVVDLATKVSGQLYKFVSTTLDGDNLQHVGGPNAFLGGINRKHQPTMALCGTQPLIDVSSATQGDSIHDDASSAYQYCVARKGGECRSGSTQGDIYVNCPFVAPRANGTFGCDYERGEPSLSNDICVSNTGAYLNAVVQFGFERSDPTGALARALTKGLIRYRVLDANENVHGLPDASWLLVEGKALQGGMSEWLAAKLPPYPQEDSTVRGTFVPTPISIAAEPGPNVDNVVVQFGYAENGAPESFFCTSRREACVATSGSASESNPFQFGSDGADGTLASIAGVPCAAGCSITIPALPQRVLYYQVVYRDSSNRVIGSPKIATQAIP